MTRLTVMHAALIAGIEVMKERVQKAIVRKETWIHTLDRAIIDGVTVESTVNLCFKESEFSSSGYWLRIDVHYVEAGSGPIDRFTLHISLEDKKLMVVLSEDAKNSDGTPVFFDPLDDIAVILDALASFEQMPDKLEEMIRQVEAKKMLDNEYADRRSRLTVIDNPSKNGQV